MSIDLAPHWSVTVTCTRLPLLSRWSHSPGSCPCSLPAPGHTQKSPCRCSHTSHLHLWVPLTPPRRRMLQDKAQAFFFYLSSFQLGSLLLCGLHSRLFHFDLIVHFFCFFPPVASVWISKVVWSFHLKFPDTRGDKQKLQPRIPSSEGTTHFFLKKKQKTKKYATFGTKTEQNESPGHQNGHKIKITGKRRSRISGGWMYRSLHTTYIIHHRGVLKLWVTTQVSITITQTDKNRGVAVNRERTRCPFSYQHLQTSNPGRKVSHPRQKRGSLRSSSTSKIPCHPISRQAEGA